MCMAMQAPGDVDTMPLTMTPIPFRIVSRRRETPDTCTLEIAPPDGEAFAFAPGQFNMLYAFGQGEVPISISGNPARARTIHHTVRSVGSVTRAICSLKPGATIGVRGPYGTAWPVEAARDRDVLIIAGGIGMAPLRPLIYQLMERRSEIRRVTLLYGSRTPKDLLFVREIEKWRGRLDFEVLVTVDSAQRNWRGLVGVVTTLLPAAHYNPGSAVAMVCGPEIMMRLTVRDLLHLGMSPTDIYVSLERNMKCALGVCGHCQFGPMFVCKDGPVFSYDRVARYLDVREM
jgi:NAD(P)H-flavin reductase